MTSEKEENDFKTSQSPKRSCCREITADDINIPLDLTLEILKKLPAKSLVRFQCVSKQWSTIIGSRKDFIDSIVTRSLAHSPRDNLHFIFHHCSLPEPFFIFSSTYPRKYHAVSIPRQCQDDDLFEYQYVRGLICCRSSLVSRLVMIYNPTTRKSFPLPEIESPSSSINFFFGYDPVMNQYKVMCVSNGLEESEHVCQVFTLRDPMKKWRNIRGMGDHSPIIRGVHINGTIYYGAKTLTRSENRTIYSGEAMLLSFDFRSERFDQIKAPKVVTDSLRNPTLVNYKGKLGCLCCNNGAEMWIMENAEKQEWSNTIFCLPDNPFKGLLCHRFSGVTLGGEIFILQLTYGPDDPLYVYSYDPKQNSFRRTEIQGTTTPHSDLTLIIGVSDHVENTMCL